MNSIDRHFRFLSAATVAPTLLVNHHRKSLLRPLGSRLTHSGRGTGLFGQVGRSDALYGLPIACCAPRPEVSPSPVCPPRRQPRSRSAVGVESTGEGGDTVPITATGTVTVPTPNRHRPGHGHGRDRVESRSRSPTDQAFPVAQGQNRTPLGQAGPRLAIFHPRIAGSVGRLGLRDGSLDQLNLCFRTFPGLDVRPIVERNRAIGSHGNVQASDFQI